MSSQSLETPYKTITIDPRTSNSLAKLKSLRNHNGLLGLTFIIIAVALVTLAVNLSSKTQLNQTVETVLVLVLTALVGFLVFKGINYLRACLHKDGVIKEFYEGYSQVSKALIDRSPSPLAKAIKHANNGKNILLKSWMTSCEASLSDLVEQRHKLELQTRLSKEVADFKRQYEAKASEMHLAHPLYQALFALQAAEKQLKKRRDELEAEWNRVYATFSWWNKLKHAGALDFKELDKKISEIERAQKSLIAKHEFDFTKLKTYYAKAAEQAFERVVNTSVTIEEYIKQSKYDDKQSNDLLKSGLLLSAMSVPVSLWSDVNNAAEVYDVLRSVNGNFVGMSDAEIWWETLFWPSDKLAGLVSLTKGAYLESLVAAESGGQLYEHFNHPDTDIVIDGVAYQIKATDSEGYINSVDEGIPVIATSEVASVTGVIDSGYSNDDITETVSLAVGGSVVDVEDTAIDAVLTGVGGLGTLATLSGINHALKKYDNGGDPVEAMFEGAGIAIEGTARAAVNTMELGYKALNSKPSRFIGRQLVKALVKLDDKMMGVDKKQ